jgi:hypothetical protein
MCPYMLRLLYGHLQGGLSQRNTITADSVSDVHYEHIAEIVQRLDLILYKVMVHVNRVLKGIFVHKGENVRGEWTKLRD